MIVLLDIVPLIVLAFAAFRITRFFIIDDLLEGPRTKLHLFLINKANKSDRLHFFWDRLYLLLSCCWCAGFWCTAILYTVYMWVAPWDFGRLDVINMFAIAGIQGLLHAFEPSDA